MTGKKKGQMSHYYELYQCWRQMKILDAPYILIQISRKLYIGNKSHIWRQILRAVLSVFPAAAIKHRNNPLINVV